MMLNRLEPRKAIVEVGRRMWLRGLVAANDGNISIRLAGDRILSTPTGSSKGFLSEADLVVTDLDGHVLSSGRSRPTSELGMHLEVYRSRSDAGAVVHAHPKAATSFAAAGIPMDECLLAEAALFLGGVPVAPYATPGTPEVAASIAELIRRTDVVLLANHGALTIGASIEEAYFKMETLEHSAQIALNTSLLGSRAPLGAAQLDKLDRARQTYGLTGKVLACRTDGESSGGRLSSESLSGKDLSGDDLSGDDLSGDDLSGDDLSSDDLSGIVEEVVRRVLAMLAPRN